ncbi:GH12 family glycosyl hydrolase domain-containing protein [Nocardioides cheoyonin]|uniref:GH12 family glycosyl hydrolase domain-containing protein n=1 Tax=Nocardioides cheoyonin TaxID=3156615 RepID=UPI0032B5478E
MAEPRPRTRTAAVVVLLLAPLLALVTPASPASAAAVCAKPKFVTTEPHGMASSGVYTVDNDMWNASGYHMTQRLRVCSRSRWTVDVKVRNPTDKAVKSYPNAHRDYHNWSTGHEPRLSSFTKLRTSWAARTPGKGIYDAAYDLWLNGVADADSNEVMIWTDNRHQVPFGHRAGHLWFNGIKWQVWTGAGHQYIAFTPPRRLTHGTLGLLRPLHWLVRKGWLRKKTTVGQVGFGFEVVRTAGQRVRFATSRFSVSSARK